MSTDRRTFIKYASALLGGSLLAACSEQTPTLIDRIQDAQDPIPTPNAYRFYALKRDGDALPDGRRIDMLRYDAVISDNGQIAYTAFDDSGRIGLYRLQVDTSGDSPRVLDERSVLYEGDALDTGRAAPVGGYHIASNGDVIIAVETLVGEGIEDDKIAPHVKVEYAEASGLMTEGPALLDPNRAYMRESAIYRLTASGNRELLVAAGTKISDGHMIQGQFGPAVVSGSELMFTAFVQYHNPDTDTFELVHALLYLENIGSGAENTVLVQRSGRLPYGMYAADDLSSESVVQLFGLIDLQAGGHYSVQAHTALPSRMNDETRPAGEQTYLGSMLMVGNARRPGSAVVLAAPREIGIAPANSRDRVGIGNAPHGPRISPQGIMGSVLTLANESQRLYYGGRLVASSGDLSPAGFSIESFMTPVFGADGEMYVTVQTSDSMELMLYDGATLRTLLRTNDTLVGEATPVSLITLGTLIRHANRDGQLAFTVVREDGTSALVIGIPA
jgi:hypothetical protein